MAKVRKAKLKYGKYGYVIDLPIIPHSKDKIKAVKAMVEKVGLKLFKKGVGEYDAGRDIYGGTNSFAHGGTYYCVAVLSVEPPEVFLENNDFWQYGIGYTRPFPDTEFPVYTEGEGDLKGGYDEWVRNPNYEPNKKGEYVFNTFVVDKDSRPELFETDAEGNYLDDEDTVLGKLRKANSDMHTSLSILTE
jgi:hypothetical protein